MAAHDGHGAEVLKVDQRRQVVAQDRLLDEHGVVGAFVERDNLLPTQLKAIQDRVWQTEPAPPAERKSERSG